MVGIFFCYVKQNERLVTMEEQARVEWQQTSDTSNDSSRSVDKHAWIQGDVLAGFSFCGGGDQLRVATKPFNKLMAAITNCIN